MSQRFWVKVGEKTAGPFSGSQLRQFAADGKLRPDYFISNDRNRWVRASNVKGLSFEQPRHPAPVPRQLAEADAERIPARFAVPVVAVSTAPASPQRPQVLLGNTLATWEIHALDSCRWVSKVRGLMSDLGVLLVLNGLFFLILIQILLAAGESSPLSRGESALRTLAIVSLFALFVMAVIVTITYIKPTSAMALTTSICIFFLALGPLTAIIAIALLVSLAKIRRAETNYKIEYAEWKRLRQRLKDPRRTFGNEWFKCGRWWMKLFDNKALLLLGNSGKALTVDRPSGADSLVQKGKRFFLSGWKDAAGEANPLELKCSEEVASRWAQWADVAVSQRSKHN
jgi:hypothetical protein